MKHSNSSLLLALVIVMAQFTNSVAGQSGIAGAFADVGLGLRPLGMGGAYTALANDENSPRWNPALLAGILDPIAGFCWAKQFSVIDYNYASLVYPIHEGLGVGGYFVSAGDDVYRETTIGFSGGANGKVFNLPEMFSFGSTLKIYTTSFGNDASGGANRVTGSSAGYGLDLAISAKMTDKISFAVVGHDLVNAISWDTSVKGKYSEGLPRQLVIAGGYQDDKMALSLDFQPSFYDDVPSRFGVGTELTVFGVIKPRVGVMQNMSSEDPNRWVTFGIGVDMQPAWLGPIKIIKFGYTHLFHDIDSTPRVGLTIGW